MISTTTISSISVKPRAAARRERTPERFENARELKGLASVSKGRAGKRLQIAWKLHGNST
jgi:hypothetical protein